MGFTAIQSSSQILTFPQVQEAHAAMLNRFPSYQESLATEDPEGYFAIDFRGEIPSPPDPGAFDIAHFEISGSVGKAWEKGAMIYQQLVDFSDDGERPRAECIMSLFPQMIDPVTGAKQEFSINLPGARSESSCLNFTFNDTPGRPSWPKLTRAAGIAAMLRPVFPDLTVEETSDGFIMIAGGERFAFTPRYQTFTGNIILPWPTNELVERLKELLPSEWKPKPRLDWWIHYRPLAVDLSSAEFFEAWRSISQRIGPTPEGTITLDFSLRTIIGLETIRAGTKKKRGVPIGLGVFPIGRTYGNFVARVFSDGYRLEIHAKAPDDDLTRKITDIVGISFEPASEARVI